MKGTFFMARATGKSRKKRWLIPVIIIAAVIAVFFIYTADYYHAGEAAEAALKSDDSVKVTESDDGWFFDGPGDETALIFYPGAKVEASAYAPLMKLIAEEGTDAFLVKVPFNLAFFGTGKAGDIIKAHDYDEWYIGGHSLGGVAAADYASSHEGGITGLVLCASYPSKDVRDLSVLSVYGSNDSVLNKEKYKDSLSLMPEDMTEIVIDGGNHAQFGDYGEQDGDAQADISAEEQRSAAAEAITNFIKQ